MTPLERQAELLERIRHIWESARTQAARSVNTAHVCANWLIGKQIVEAEQRGEKRAGYGQALLKTLSAQLAAEYGSGFSVSALQYMRGFFLGYPELLAKQHAVRVEFEALPVQRALRGESPAEEAWRAGVLHPGLSWTHYRMLLKVERREVRDFYEIEAIRNGWSARQLERQINSFLFERLLKSRDKKGVMSLANEGQVPAQTEAEEARCIDRWLDEWPREEMAAALKLMLQGRGQEAERRVKARHAAWQKAQRPANVSAVPRRSVADDLRELAKSASGVRLEREAAERTQQEAECRRQREACLRAVMADVDHRWETIHEQAQRGSASGYEQAVRALAELAEGYALTASRETFDRALRRFLVRHATRGALLRRLTEAGLWSG